MTNTQNYSNQMKQFSSKMLLHWPDLLNGISCRSSFVNPRLYRCLKPTLRPIYSNFVMSRHFSVTRFCARLCLFRCAVNVSLIIIIKIYCLSLRDNVCESCFFVREYPKGLVVAINAPLETKNSLYLRI